MTAVGEETRSYGCTFGCGNPYDYVFISVRDGTTEFLCLPCFVRLASDIVSAVTEPNPEQVAKWLHTISPLAAAPMKANGAKRGRKNAPATNEDPGLFEAFDSRIDASELPAEFR